MKHVIAVLLGIAAIAIVGLGLGMNASDSSGEQEFLRLHIRANSNSTADQEVKYKVKQEIVNELTPLFVDITSKEQAMDRLRQNLALVDSVADRVLKAEGFDYTARSSVRTEYFPTRVYDGLSLAEGLYDALIINLGEGTGDNWWCVVYPPLCFLENNIGGDSGVKYRSKLQEIIKKYF